MSCETEEPISPNHNNNSLKAYIFDKNTLNVDSCQIVGYVGPIQINRICDVDCGYINIGSASVFTQDRYYVDISIYLDTIIHVKEYKLIHIK